MDRRFTEQEARQIFALAAERERAARKAPDAALTLADLEEAARAAGIDPALVRAATADVLHLGDAPMRRTVAGLPVERRRTRLVPHAQPLDDETWAEIVAACRRIFGKRGVVTDLGRRREWASEANDQSMPVHVLVQEEERGLRVTIGRNTWPQMFGLLLAGGINGGVGLVLLIGWLAAAAPNPLWIPALVLLSAMALLVGGAYAGSGRLERRDFEHFDEVFAEIERIAERHAGRRDPSALPHPEPHPDTLLDDATADRDDLDRDDLGRAPRATGRVRP